MTSEKLTGALRLSVSRIRIIKRILTLSAVFVVAAVAIIALVNVLKITQPATNAVPHEGKYGIYALDPATGKVTLIYSTSNEMYTSALRLNNHGDKFVFAQKIDGTSDLNTEIFTIGVMEKTSKD